jgi:hypothetical protein
MKKIIPERQKKRQRKTTMLRRLCYKWVRDNLPEVWEQMRIEVGMRPSNEVKEKESPGSIRRFGRQA